MRPLVVGERGVATCSGGHSFDRARDGYYNLLLSNVGGTHGDNREMLEARRRFLDTGAYKPLADKLSELVLLDFPKGGYLLDIGCGEGYYTSAVSARLNDADKRPSIYGFDISKDGVRMTAKRDKSLFLAVASAYKMPFADESFDVALNVFSPLALEETVRILRHGGRFVMAIPDVNHLFGLKCALYQTPYKNKPESPELEGLDLVAVERVHYTLSLRSAEEINALFMMTPYAYRTPPESRARLLSMSSLETEVEFVVFVYQKP
jgi:23S rRNA (guanine745-N1)-methyltransferase